MLVLMFCACIRIVNRVGHSWAGEGNRGGIPTFVTSIGLLMSELKADHTGIVLEQGPLSSCKSSFLSLNWYFIVCLLLT